MQAQQVQQVQREAPPPRAVASEDLPRHSTARGLSTTRILGDFAACQFACWVVCLSVNAAAASRTTTHTAAEALLCPALAHGQHARVDVRHRHASRRRFMHQLAAAGTTAAGTAGSAGSGAAGTAAGASIAAGVGAAAGGGVGRRA